MGNIKMPYPAIIAHRGACGYLPEHTLPAVELAHTFDADYIEQDVVLTSDGVPIVLHDVTLELTTNVATLFPERHRDDGLFYAIDFTLEEIKALNAHERTDSLGNPVFPERYSGTEAEFKVPTLAEEIETVDRLNKSSGKRTGVYIELKRPEFHEQEGVDIYQAVIDVLTTFDRLGENAETVIQCFDPETLKRFAHEGTFKGPLVQLVLTESIANWRGDFEAMHTTSGLKEVAEYAHGIGPDVNLLENESGGSSEMVVAAKKLGLFLHPYTLRADSESIPGVNFEALHKKLFIDLEVDGAFTDFADQTRELLIHMGKIS
ncbi:MAG: glycerophosphodiester phosphodiesterase [Luminiphilus sp.]